MAKRIYKTDSKAFRARVKAGKITKEQLKGNALSYYNRFKGAEKSRQKKVDSVAQIDKLVIPKDSQIYKIITHAAEIKGVTVRQFVSEYKNAVLNLIDDGETIIDRESNKLQSDIQRLQRGGHVFISNDLNGFHKVSKMSALTGLVQFVQYVLGVSDIFLLLFRTYYKLNGDIYFSLPDEGGYDGYEGEDLETYLDGWYPEIKYIKSAKQNDKRAKKTDQGNLPNQQPKRKKRS